MCEEILLDNYLKKSVNYFEFCSESPSKLVFYKSNIKEVMLSFLNNDFKVNSSRITCINNNGDVKKYISSISFADKVDTVYVNGKYRIACLLNLLNYIDSRVNIIVSNYFSNKNTGIIEYYYNIVNQYNDTVVLNRKSGNRPPTATVIEIYENFVD